MWILANEQKEAVNVPEVDEANYYELNVEKRLEILLSTLSTEFEIYIRGNAEDGEIMLYCAEYGDFIHENGNKECNLVLFWERVVIPLLEEQNKNRILLPA